MSKSDVKDCLVGLWGLRGYKKSILPEIVFNRIIHKFGYHYCDCKKFVKLDDCFGVINNDCVMCLNCVGYGELRN